MTRPDDDLLRRIEKELAAWSYGIGHDLSSPLRAISGFSEVLAEDYAERLDEEGANYLLRIRSAAARMEELIDHFRQLGKVTSGELRRQPVDLSAIARSIAGKLRERDAARDVEIVIEPSLTVEGDPALLTIALEHLMENAWKFTRGQGQAKIEVGREPRNGGFVFFVRDNGAGFDPDHAHKLFIPYQRLHAASEFEGVGIGLAVVRRIVHRHGGTAWATGAVGQGATVHLDLSRAGDPDRLA
jgi:light-regulated signal transduction histidine kinase (bacteriophytochrome)